jgi:AcrR family transcriptional regulator
MKHMLKHNQVEQPEDPPPEKSAGVRERKREEKFEQILTASIAVFTEEGYSGFSMRKVAERADVRLNTIQHHFDDLDTLLATTVRTMSQNYVSAYHRIAENTDIPPLERLEIIVEYNLHEAQKFPIQAFFVEAQAASLHSQKIFTIISETYAEYLNILAGLIKEIESRPDTEALIIATMIAAWQEGVMSTQRFTPARSLTAGAVMVRIKAACLSLVSNGKLTKDK